MANSLLDQLLRTGTFGGGAARRYAEAVTPRRSFADLVLPEPTRRALEQALVQIRKHDLLFTDWGLAERHGGGTGLAFNFAGPPGTGKTLCAEAVAHALGRDLLVVRYADLESQWLGQTGKHLAALFAAARESGAVLFFDEADAIAARRFTAPQQGIEREQNAITNVLLRELEAFPGVVIFATNLAANFDPAFERRLRTHVLFERPGAEARAQIWPLQLHPTKTPLAPDVDFEALAARYDLAGGDIQNAVLKAAQAAAAEPGPDAGKQIHQRHFEAAAEDVLAARRTMAQTLYDDPTRGPAASPESTALTRADGGVPASPAAREAVALMEGVERRWRGAFVALAAGTGGALLLAALAVVLALVG